MLAGVAIGKRGTDESPSPHPAVVKKSPRLGRLGFSNETLSSSMDQKINKFDAAMQSSGCRFEVYHLVMTGGKFDFWGCTLKNNNNHYWSWKPKAIENAIKAEQHSPVFDEQNTTLDEMLLFARAALIRETPKGENKKAEIKLKSGISLDAYICIGFVDHPSTEESVKSHAQAFANVFTNDAVKRVYATALSNVMWSPKALQDAGKAGPLWTKLANASQNSHIVYQRLNCLSELLLNDKIEEVFLQLYDCLVPGESPSMWPKDIQELAFGDLKS